MKKIITLLFVTFFCLSGCSTTLPPAQQTSTPMEKADAIWVYTEDEPKEAYRKISQIITDNGYTISSSDATLMNISTEPKKMEAKAGDILSGARRTVTINASVREKDNTIIKLVGTRNLTGSNSSEVSTLFKEAWSELKNIAQSYPEAEIKYSRNI